MEWTTKGRVIKDGTTDIITKSKHLGKEPGMRASLSFSLSLVASLRPSSFFVFGLT